MAEPLPAAAFTAPGVRIAVAPPLARYVLRARDPAVLARLTGLAIPRRIGELSDGVGCLGPDEWLALLPPDRTLAPDAGAGAAASIVEVSARAIGLAIEGPRAAATIGAGCPLDLAAIAPGRITRTLFESVEIVLIRASAAQFRIEVWRSFAPWLWAALTAAAGDLD